MDQEIRGADVESADYPQYTFKHSISGVLVKAVGLENHTRALAYVENMVEDLPFIFPEGGWELIGIKHYHEEW